jgi:hypothetical protein
MEANMVENLLPRGTGGGGFLPYLPIFSPYFGETDRNMEANMEVSLLRFWALLCSTHISFFASLLATWLPLFSGLGEKQRMQNPFPLKPRHVSQRRTISEGRQSE